jgi:hypothetical protein
MRQQLVQALIEQYRASPELLRYGAQSYSH